MTGPVTKLNRIHDAMLQTIMEMTAEELRQSFIDEGEDPDKIAEDMRVMIKRLIQGERRYGAHAIENVEIQRDGATFTEVVVSGDRATVFAPAASSANKPEAEDRG